MTSQPRELPADREKALEAIAGGWTRMPTNAHPDCLCGRRAQYTPVKFVEGRTRIWVARGWTKTIPCPIHSRRR